MDFVTSALILAWVAILILTLAMAGLLRQVRTLSSNRTPQRQLGPSIGTEAPPLHPGDEPRPGVPTVALFLDPGCESCDRSLDQADKLAATTLGRLRFVAVFSAAANGHRPRRVELVEHGAEAFSRYRIPLTPFGVVVDGERRIVRAAPLGSDAALDDLVLETLKEG